jgi:hypothetical protein
MAMGPEFREDPASINAEEQARRRKLVADQIVTGRRRRSLCSRKGVMNFCFDDANVTATSQRSRARFRLVSTCVSPSSRSRARPYRHLSHKCAVSLWSSALVSSASAFPHSLSYFVCAVVTLASYRAFAALWTRSDAVQAAATTGL